MAEARGWTATRYPFSTTKMWPANALRYRMSRAVTHDVLNLTVKTNRVRIASIKRHAPKQLFHPPPVVLVHEAYTKVIQGQARPKHPQDAEPATPLNAVIQNAQPETTVDGTTTQASSLDLTTRARRPVRLRLSIDVPVVVWCLIATMRSLYGTLFGWTICCIYTTIRGDICQYLVCGAMVGLAEPCGTAKDRPRLVARGPSRRDAVPASPGPVGPPT